MGEKLTKEARAALIAVYGSIDACGGTFSPDDERSGYADGYREALERALMEIDKVLNDDAGPDEAWIEEGWKRFCQALNSRQALQQGEGND